VDFDRLDLYQMRNVSRIIDLLGIPTATDELNLHVQTLEACAALYRKALIIASEANRRHGE
jgi:hypothetical protein